MEVAIHHAVANRYSFEAGMNDAARDAISAFCHDNGDRLNSSVHRYLPRRANGKHITWIASPEHDQSVSIDNLVSYLAILNTDHDALLSDYRVIQGENAMLRAMVGAAKGPHPKPVFYTATPALAPRCKRRRYLFT